MGPRHTFNKQALKYDDERPNLWDYKTNILFYFKTYQCLMISSRFICEWLYLMILATAEIAFSVALMLWSARESGAEISAASSGTARAHALANCAPPNCASTPQPYEHACRTSASAELSPLSIGSRKMSWYFTHAGPEMYVVSYTLYVIRCTQ